MDRYHRQALLPEVGGDGQARLRGATAVVIGVGALGTVIADGLCRAGVGRLVLVDRDVVELTNLQRQTLFDEADVGEPKAAAAAGRLRRVNGDVMLEPRAIDVTADNVMPLVRDATIVLDGTDNAGTRYLVNDACVKLGVPWVYGAAVGTTGRAMAVVPGRTACLRCVFREMPAAGELATCDTSGVLAAAAGVAGNLQVAAALRMIVELRVSPFCTAEEAKAGASDIDREESQIPEASASASSEVDTSVLHAFDVWRGTSRQVRVERDPECPCCGRREFPFLDAPPAEAATLCGRDAIQVRGGPIDLRALAAKVASAGEVRATAFMIKLTPADRSDVRLTAFADGRVIVQGTSDPAAARSLVARYLGG